ncbi:MAG: amino acid racemase [Clostridiales bacterium]|jgi:aspartate racemase|nr:amino acid racemase [Clostridiales bacterium]
MKSVGIIGGVGPATTGKFYEKIIQGCQELERGLNNQYRPHVFIASVPISYEEEENEILYGIISRHKELLKDEAVNLEKAGSDFICMPCNTLHRFASDIQEAINIPFVNIINETVDFIMNNKLSKIGLLSTGLTASSKLYESVFNKIGINFLSTNKTEQDELNSIIFRLTNNKQTKEDKKYCEDIIEKMYNNGADSIILACTDLQLLGLQSTNIKIYDTLEILASSVIKKIIND